MNNFQESLLSFADNVEVIQNYGKPISKRSTDAMIYSLKMSAVQAKERGDKNGAQGIRGAITLIDDTIEQGQFNSERLGIVLGCAFVELTKELQKGKPQDYEEQVKTCITSLIAVANLLSKDIVEESGERVSE